MRFELRPTYPNWKGSERMTLHVDQEGLEAARRGDLPSEVMTELREKRMYHADGPPWALIAGMSVVADL